MSTLSRAVKSFRLGPRSFLRGLRSRKGLDAGDLADAADVARFFGPPPVAVAPGAPGHLVLLSYLALPFTMKVEALLARALQSRGWTVSVVTSESAEPLARAYFGPALGCKLLRLEDFLDFGNPPDLRGRVAEALDLARRDLALFKAYAYRNAPVALHSLATLSAARPEGVVGSDPASLRLLGRYLRRTILAQEAARALFAQLRPTLALGVEKGFVGTCETFYAALESGTDYVQWVSCHEPESIMLKRYRPETFREHPFSISDRNWERLRGEPWREAYRETVMAEFERGYRSGDWFRYKGLSAQKTFAGRAELQQRLGLDPGKRTAIIYSHILNDANLFYGTDLFSGGYEQWLVETVRAASRNPAVNWVLKVHPANVQRNARVGYSGEYGELLALARAFGRVPEFLRVVRPEDSVSPLSFFALTDWGITVRGTVGLELPCLGVPVLTAGSGRYSGKGFTIDPDTPQAYLDAVAGIHHIPPLGEEQVRLGVRYAYHVFRSRPARYGAVLEDVYGKPVQHPRHRDLAFRLPSIGEVLAHPQMCTIVHFLCSPGEDDFLDPGFAHG
ncbi:MAG: hypothetical protein ACT4P9_15625 [Betaproteobacteria bacterium]